jgi:hypothetical protein
MPPRASAARAVEDAPPHERGPITWKLAGVFCVNASTTAVAVVGLLK